MKICNSCGMQNNDEDMFCKQCGALLQSQQEPAASGYADNMYDAGGAAYAAQAQNPYPLLQLLKEKGGSVLFLIATILTTLQLVVTLYNTFTLDMMKLLSSVLPAELFSEMMSGSNTTETFQILTVIAIVFSLIAALPSVCIIIGLWNVFATCKKAGSEPLSTAGFSWMQAGIVIQFIYFIIGMATLALFALYLFLVVVVSGSAYEVSDMIAALGATGADASSLQSVLNVACIVLLLIVVLAIVLGFMYYIKLFGAIRAGKLIIQTGSAPKNVASFVGVFTMLGGISATFSGLTGLNVAAIAEGVALILFAALLFSFRKAAAMYIQK